MGKRQSGDVGDSDKKTSSGVQGSGRFLFALAKILVDVIDDELQVSDAHTCVGKKVDKVKRVGRVVTSAAGKVSVQGATLGCDQDDCEAPLSWFK
jgi:hypothetical protein